MDIATDLDGVIAHPYEPLAERMIKKFGVMPPYEEWNDPVFENMLPEEDRSWVREQFSDPAFWNSVEIFADSLEWLHRMKRKNRIIIVTARPAEVEDVTRKFLKERKVPFAAIYFVEREEKHEMLKVLNPKFMIEDDPRNAKSISESGTKCYIVNRPYNIEHDVGKAIRIDSLNEIGVK